jgi:hypothetical protein
MIRILLVLLLFPSLLWAENPIPDPPDGGITFVQQTKCTDLATSEKGYCFIGHDLSGNWYVTFWQNDRLMKISKVVGEEVTVLWQDINFATY